jgi:hypothetical protein
MLTDHDDEGAAARGDDEEQPGLKAYLAKCKETQLQLHMDADFRDVIRATGKDLNSVTRAAQKSEKVSRNVQLNPLLGRICVCVFVCGQDTSSFWASGELPCHLCIAIHAVFARG